VTRTEKAMIFGGAILVVLNLALALPRAINAVNTIQIVEADAPTRN